jgi:hypothetical protein
LLYPFISLGFNFSISFSLILFKLILFDVLEAITGLGILFGFGREVTVLFPKKLLTGSYELLSYFYTNIIFFIYILYDFKNKCYTIYILFQTFFIFYASFGLIILLLQHVLFDWFLSTFDSD